MPTRKYWTLGQIVTKLRKDLDLESEVFVRPDEIIEYINEAIDEAEAEIHTLYEDYFLTDATLSLVSGSDEYELPSDIYAHKIRRIVYNNGSSVYTMERIRDWKKFEVYTTAKNFNSSDLYQWYIINKVAAEPRIRLVPKARETGAFAEVHYLRQANRLEESSDICDIPEFVSFIFQFVKCKVYEKEVHPNYEASMIALERQRMLMQGTLAGMTPDAHNEIEMDYSYYEEFN